MTAEDAADLGRCRRGVEPLRIVIMPQHYQQVTTSPIVGGPAALRQPAGGTNKRLGRASDAPEITVAHRFSAAVGGRDL
jgi:hypothetical protein